MLANLRKSLKLILLFVLSLYVSVWLLSPLIANHYLGQYFETHGLKLNEETNIRYNPFRSRLEINDLGVNDDEFSNVLSLSFLSFELHLHELLFEEIYVPQVAIKGLNLTVEKLGNDIVIGGISIEKANRNQKEPTLASNPMSEKSHRNIFFNRFVMPSFVLEEANIIVNIGQNQHHLKVNEINVSDLFATEKEQSVAISILSELDNGDIEIGLTVDLLDLQGGIVFDVNVSDVDVNKFNHLLPADIDSIQGFLSYQGQHRLDLQGDSIKLNIESGRLTGKGIDAGKEGVHIEIGQQEINLDGFIVVLNKGQAPKIEGESSILIQNLIVYNKDKSEKISKIERLDIGLVTLYNDENGVQNVNVEQVNLHEVFFSDNDTDPVPALVKFATLKIQNLELSQYGIEIGDISLAGLIANAELDEKKQVKNLLKLPSNKPNTTDLGNPDSINDALPEATDENNIVSSKPKFSVKLNSFSLSDEAEIFFKDNSVSPTYERKVSIKKLIAGPFDSENSEQKSTISISGKSNRYAKFAFVTTAKPFLDKPIYNIEGEFNELSLPSLSSYIKQALQYEIESGQLDLGIEVKLVGTEIDGEVDVILRGIELTAADDSEVSSLIDHTSVPFNIALGMLKDSDGNVELNLPITGDTSSPDFGLSGLLTLLVKQATIIGARDYLVTTFIPFAQVVNIAVLAGEFALKVRINDLPYTAKETDLQPDQQEFLQQFSALLKDQADTQVKLCAIATAKDIDKKAGSDITNPEDIKRLKAISMQRIDTFKAYMIEIENIQSARLLLCTPQIDSSVDAVSRLSFET